MKRGLTDGRGAAGFTMLEMAIVGIIIGLLAWAFMDFMQSYTNREKVEEARRNAEYAAAEVKGYLLGNKGKLPDPRTGNLLPLEIGNTRDPWGNELLYWRADELDDTSVADVDSTEMEIRIISDLAAWNTVVAAGGADPYTLGQTSSSWRLIRNVAYAVVSPGKDLTQHVTVTSGSIHVNILADGTVARDASGSERPFDDIVEYATLGQLRTAYATSGESEGTQAPRGGGTAAVSLAEGLLSTGGTAVDFSSYVPDGGNVSMVSIDVGSGEALSLGGETDDYIAVTDAAEKAQYAFGTYTIMTWFKTDEDYDPTGNNFAVITSRQISTAPRNWWLTLWGSYYTTSTHTTGTIGFRASYTENSTTKSYDLAGPRLDDELWHFVAVSMRKQKDGDGNETGRWEAELYVDGAVVDSQDAVAAPHHGASYPLYIGAGTYTTTSGGTTTYRRFEGLLDSFYIYGTTDDSLDGSLTAEEVDAFYQASKGDYGY